MWFGTVSFEIVRWSRTLMHRHLFCMKQLLRTDHEILIAPPYGSHAASKFGITRSGGSDVLFRMGRPLAARRGARLVDIGDT